MPGPDVHEGLTPEGNEIERAARANALWLKEILTPGLLEQAIGAGKISRDDEISLNSYMDPENYIAMDDEKRAQADELIAKIRKFVESAE